MKNDHCSAEAGEGRNVTKPCSFSQVVRGIVIHERRGALRDIAATLGLSYGAFYNRLTGRAEFNPREINVLIKELADPRLVESLLKGTGFRGLRVTAAGSRRPEREVLDIAMSCALESLNIVRVTMDALKNHDLGRDKSLEIEGIISHAQNELSSLQLALVDSAA